MITYATKTDELISIAKIIGAFILFFFIFFGFLTNWYGWFQEPIGVGVQAPIQPVPSGECHSGKTSEREICLQLKRIADSLENNTGVIP